MRKQIIDNYFMSSHTFPFRDYLWMFYRLISHRVWFDDIICLISPPNSKRFDEFYLFFVTEYFITMYSPPPPQKSRPYQLAPIQSRFPRPGPKPIFARNEMDYSSSDPSSGLVFYHTISIWFIMCFTKSCKVIILCHILPFLKQVVFLQFD